VAEPTPTNRRNIADPSIQLRAKESGMENEPPQQGKSKISQLWDHAKRSWIVQWTVAYCAFAFGAFDCLEIAGHAMEWPSTVSHIASIILILGIPITTFLAWYHGEQARVRVSGSELVIIVLLLLTIGSVWKLMGRPIGQPQVSLGQLLSERDPAIFYGSRKHDYEIARVLHNQAALREETQFSEEIRGAHSSFYLMANTAGSIFRSHEPEFEDALKRGVHVRVLLSDYSAANDANMNSFASAVGEDPMLVHADGKAVSEIIMQLMEKVNKDKATYRGDLDLRWFAKPLFYTAWIRDGTSAEAIAHLSVHMYRSKNEWPAFRFGKDSKLMVESLRLDYESLWRSSKTSL
jgi:hypothetical protein